MSEFFSDMRVLERILWYIAIPFSLALIIQTALTFIGAGGDELEGEGDIEIDSIDTDEDILGFRVFTIRNLVAFFTFFSWTGIVLLRSDVKDFWAITIAILAGLTAVAVTISLFVFITKMTEKGNVNYKNAIGKEGMVYLTIPADMQGKGKVEINIQSRLSYIDAMTDETGVIKTGEKVFVTGVENNILIVERKGGK